MEIEVLLKDGTFLKCVIYETGSRGEYPINNETKIHNKFQKQLCHERFQNDLIYFQTEYINGHFHPANVLYYSIKDKPDEN